MNRDPLQFLSTKRHLNYYRTKEVHKLDTTMSTSFLLLKNMWIVFCGLGKDKNWNRIPLNNCLDYWYWLWVVMKRT